MNGVTLEFAIQRHFEVTANWHPPIRRLPKARKLQRRHRSLEPSCPVFEFSFSCRALLALILPNRVVGVLKWEQV
jgi:hypothetical protein